MFWTFFLQAGNYYPSMFPCVLPTNSTPPSPSLSVSSDHSSPVEPKRRKVIKLNLTEEDLIKAGYETSKKPWTQEEDLKLMDLREKDKLDWSKISAKIEGRNAKMCYSRYRRLQNQTKNLWKQTQNEKLCELVGELGEDWKRISKNFQNRTHKQVKEHYLNYLRPEIRKEEWTLEQDLKLVECLKLYGKNWRQIEECLDGRTQNQIKNRYFGRLKKLSEKKALLKGVYSEMERNPEI